MKALVNNKYISLEYIPRVLLRLNRQIITDDQF